MNTSSEFTSLFEAFRDARRAYERLYAKGLGRPDQELARDPDYRIFHRSGMQLAHLGGTAAIQGAIALLCQSSHGPTTVGQAEIERLWAGMGTWTN